jgi:hypothetical protein
MKLLDLLPCDREVAIELWLRCERDSSHVSLEPCCEHCAEGVRGQIRIGKAFCRMCTAIGRDSQMKEIQQPLPQQPNVIRMPAALDFLYRTPELPRTAPDQFPWTGKI